MNQFNFSSQRINKTRLYEMLFNLKVYKQPTNFHNNKHLKYLHRESIFVQDSFYVIISGNIVHYIYSAGQNQQIGLIATAVNKRGFLNQQGR